MSNQATAHAATSDLPFLVTHWLSNYHVDDKQSEEVIRIRKAAAELSAAFSSLGAFGKKVLVRCVRSSAPIFVWTILTTDLSAASS
jgi:hypothetical protein